MLRTFLFIFLCGFISLIPQLRANPFAIKFPEQKTLSHDDYIGIQKQLRAINIDTLISDYYVSNQGYATYADFLARCSRGIWQVLINPDKGYFPITKLEKIGNGGDKCIVCCVPFDELRLALIESIPEALEKSGFNGYFYYRLGGFPNPSGREIQFAGVPYCFKIFMMLEAQNLGFNKVIWIDSACLPLRDPTPLFHWLDQTGGVLILKHPNARYLLPATRQLLLDLTQIDVMKAPFIQTVVFGLKMHTNQTKKLIEEYYDMVELGTPFLSCFPEEFVLSALINKFQYPSKLRSPYKIFRRWDFREDTSEKFEVYKKEGYFFYQRKH